MCIRDRGEPVDYADPNSPGHSPVYSTPPWPASTGGYEPMELGGGGAGGGYEPMEPGSPHRARAATDWGTGRGTIIGGLRAIGRRLY